MNPQEERVMDVFLYDDMTIMMIIVVMVMMMVVTIMTMMMIMLGVVMAVVLVSSVLVHKELKSHSCDDNDAD